MVGFGGKGVPENRSEAAGDLVEARDGVPPPSLEDEQSRVVLEPLDARYRDTGSVPVPVVDDDVPVIRVGDWHDHGRNAQKACRDTVQPGITERSGQGFIGAPVFGQVIEIGFFDPKIVGHVVTNEHGVIGQEASVFDMYELFEHAERKTGRAVGDRTPSRIPPAVVVQPEPAVEALRGVRPRETPHPHQAGAPQETRAMRFSTIRAPASVRMSSIGVRPPKLFKPL